MKKRLIASVIVLTSLAIAPKYVAIEAEKSLRSSISQINSIPGYTAHIEEFKSGWFASSAKIEVGYDLLAMSPQATTEEYPFPTKGSVIVDYNASHGPILFGGHAGIGLLGYTVTYSGEEARDTLIWADSTAFYTLTGNMGLFGGSKFSDNIAAFKAVEDLPYSIDFSGYQGRGEYTSGKYTYSGESEKFELNYTDYLLSAAELSFDISMQGNFFEALQGAIFDSTINFGLNNFTIKDPSGTQDFALEGLNLGAVTIIDKQANLASGVINYGFQTIDMLDYKTSDIVVQMEINNLSLEFVESYQLFARELGNSQPEEINDKALEFAQSSLLPALIASPELNISDFHATIPEGNINATLFTKLTGITSMPDDLTEQAFWFQHLLANANIKMDKAVVLKFAQQQLRTQIIAQIMENPDAAEITEEELDQIVIQQTPMMLEALQDQGLITETENRYTTSFELKDGKAQLNGNPIPIPNM